MKRVGRETANSWSEVYKSLLITYGFGSSRLKQYQWLSRVLGCYEEKLGIVIGDENGKSGDGYQNHTDSQEFKNSSIIMMMK